MSQQTGRILAIDYGLRRVGLAVTDPLGIIANPLDTVFTVDILGYLERYLRTEFVSTIVIGKPMRMNGSMSQLWPQIEDFALKLGGIIGGGIEIKFEDERFTSKMASAVIAQSGLPRSKRQDKGLIDRTSAVIILQSYLEHK